MKNQLLAAAFVACLAVALTLPDASPAKTAKKSQQGSSAKESPPPPPTKKTGSSKGPAAPPTPAPPPAAPTLPAASGPLNRNFTAPVARLPGVISAMQMRPAPVADQEVCLFQNANFTGWKFCTNLTSLQILPAPYQRQLTSIKIPDGYLLRFYPTPNRSGWSCVFYGQVEKVSDECDNVANAISFEPDPEWPAKQAEAARQAQERDREAAAAITASLTVPVQMLPDMFCFSLELDFKGGGLCASETSLHAIGPEIQGRIKSIEIERGYRLRLFENTDGTGGSCVFYGQVSPIPDGCGEMARAYVYELDPAFTLSQFIREKQNRDRERARREAEARSQVEGDAKQQAREARRAGIVSSGRCAARLSITDNDLSPFFVGRSHFVQDEHCANSAAVSDVGNLNTGTDWNDNFEIVQIENPYVKFIGYRDINFGGPSVTVTCGTHELIDEPENEISSYKIEIMDEAVSCNSDDIRKWN